MENWKRTKKEQPKLHGMYLTYRPNAPLGNQVATIRWDDAMKRWCGNFNVTHWMPLPEAPTS